MTVSLAIRGPVRPGIAHRLSHSGDASDLADGAGETAPGIAAETHAAEFAELSAEALRVGGPRLRDRRTVSTFDRERILDDDADAKLLEIERAGRSGYADSGGELLDLTQQHFADPSDALAALRDLRSRPGLAAYGDVLAGAERDLLAMVPRRTIIAGINSALEARAYAPDAGVGPSALRTLYRDFLTCVGNELDVYADWIREHETLRRGVIVQFVGDALAADIGSSEPSCSVPEFAGLVGRSRALAVLRSAELVFVDTLARTATRIEWPGTPPAADSVCAFAHLLIDGLRGGSSAGAMIDWLMAGIDAVNDAHSRATLASSLLRGFRAVLPILFSSDVLRVELLEGFVSLIETLATDERRLGRCTVQAGFV